MIHNDTNVVVVPVLQPKLDSVDFLFSLNAHSFYSNNVPGDRYHGCKTLGSNIFVVDWWTDEEAEGTSD